MLPNIDKPTYVTRGLSILLIIRLFKQIDFFSDKNMTNCADIRKSNQNITTGVFGIRPIPSRLVQTNCDHVTKGGGWTIIQKREDGSVNFFRGWEDYKKGFGNKSGEYWLGLDAIHDLTSQEPFLLRVELEAFNGAKRYAQYGKFFVANETEKYRLTVGIYTGM